MITDEQNTIMDGTERLRACERMLRDSIYKSPAMDLAHQAVKAELDRLEIEVPVSSRMTMNATLKNEGKMMQHRCSICRQIWINHSRAICNWWRAQQRQN